MASRRPLGRQGLGADIDLRSLIDHIPVGVVLLDTERRIVWMNHALEALTGFTQQEAGGVSCRHILRHRLCVSDCPAHRMGADSESESAETDLINRDRMRVPVSVSVAPLRDATGRLAGFLETVEDLRPVRDLGVANLRAYSFADIVGRSPQLEKIFQILPAIAQSDSSILITGETGTGKDLVAEALHRASGRAKGPFVKVNCGALPETLLESELFGHRKGAFTGAVENKPGRFRLAHGGTLYLTEIGDLPLALQVKLLTFLDDQVVYPLGSTRGFQADVRIVAATHRHLERMVREGRFREDLIFRLNVVRLHIPPLREREGDVRLLLDHFLNRLNARLGKDIAGFSRKALEVLLGYPYPGNVRELQNVVEYAVNVCRQRRITQHHLPAYLTEAPAFPPAGPAEGTETRGRQGPPGTPALGPAPDTWPLAERQMIIEALVGAGGRRGRAAARLGWSRSTLWRKMKHHGLLPD